MGKVSFSSKFQVIFLLSKELKVVELEAISHFIVTHRERK